MQLTQPLLRQVAGRLPTSSQQRRSRVCVFYSHVGRGAEVQHQRGRKRHRQAGLLERNQRAPPPGLAAGPRPGRPAAAVRRGRAEAPTAADGVGDEGERFSLQADQDGAAEEKVV